jgi:hypothetical protein
MWRRVNLVWIDVSEERIASIFRVEKSTSEVPEWAGGWAQSAATCSLWFLACGFFYPEDGGDSFLRKAGSHKIYTTPHPRRRHSLKLFFLTKNDLATKTRSEDQHGLDHRRWLSQNSRSLCCCAFLEVFYIPFFRHRAPLPFVFLQLFSQITANHASVVHEMATVM